jgi:hypothetical protein
MRNSELGMRIEQGGETPAFRDIPHSQFRIPN